MRRRRPARFLVFGLAIVLVVGTLTVRLVYLQIAQGEHFAAQSDANRMATEAIPASRGLIYDRSKHILVNNVPTYAVKIRPADLPYSLRDEIIGRLASLLSMDAAEINRRIDANPGSRFDLVRIADDVAEPTARLIAEERVRLPGVEVVVEARRDYLYGALISQVLGYTGAIDAEELAALRDQGYLPDDRLGKSGVESVYETALRGVYGEQRVERDATGREVQVLATTREPEAGDSLILTLDLKEQRNAQKALEWGLKTAGISRGVLIAINPQTGEILAMVSLPTYDNNDFAGGISQEKFDQLLENPGQPLLNHAIGEQYPPGSTYKLVTGTGALADDKIEPGTQILTKPYIQIGPDKFWDWNRQGFGLQDIYSGLAHSSDTYFYQLAQMLGIDRLAYWARQYGFGSPSGIDLPGEAAGNVPTDQWKQDTFGQAIFEGEVLQAGIGQGYDTVTPLQLLNAYAALANGGKLYQPQVVREIIGPDGTVVRPFKKKLIHKLDVSSAVLKTMREAAREVVVSRHTYNFVDLPIVVSGKTGTAEYGVRDVEGRLPYHNWFVAYVSKSGNVDKPDSELAVVAFTFGSNTIGNAATEIVKYYLQLHYGIEKDYRLPSLLERGNFYGD